MSSQKWWIGIFTLFSCCAYAQDETAFPLSGRLYTDHYVFTSGENSRRLAQSSLSAWLEYNLKLNESMSAKALSQTDLFYRDLNHPDRPSANFQLREGFISYQTEGSDLRVGQQIIPWGKSDGINPTDYFTAKNYTLLNPDDEVKRLGAPAINWNYTPLAGNSPFSFQGVIQAFYPQTRFIIPDSVIPVGLNVNRYPKDPTPFSSESMEYGFKISYLQSNYDVSISAFHGFAHFPQYVFDFSRQSVDAVNPRETAVGSDASFTASDLIIRLETALHMPVNGKDSDPLFGIVEPWHWDSVIGIERPVLDDFRLQVQLLYRWHLYYSDGPYTRGASPLINQIQQGVARANQTLLNFRRRGNPGATFRFGYANESSKWTADLFLVGYFAIGQDFLLRPQVGYTPYSNLKLMAGMDLYGGDTSGPLGALHAQSDAFFEAKYLF